MRNIDIITKTIEALKDAFVPLGVENQPDLSRMKDNLNGDKVVIFGKAFDVITTDYIKKKDIEKLSKKTPVEKTLILTEVISPDIAEAMHKYKINFCDTMGNIQICLGNIRLSNMESEYESSKPETSINLNTMAAMKVIFSLLRYKDAIQWPMRRVADTANVSLGSVQRVMEALKKNALIFITPNGKFFKNKRKLLEIWVGGFNSIILPKITLGHAVFRNPESREGWRNMNMTDDIMWGGEPAAQLMDGYLKAEDFSVFTSMDFRTTARILNLIPTGSSGYISILKKFWRDDSDDSANENKNTVPLLIAYAQLMGNFDSRFRDAGRRLLNSLEDEELSE